MSDRRARSFASSTSAGTYAGARADRRSAWRFI
jgi:hypothetical protein